MKLKHLESRLSSLPNRAFEDPKVELEQYPTSVHLTSSIALTALSKNDAGPGITVLDLGCGVGILGLGFALVNCDFVYLIDCDDDALALARDNVDYLVDEELIGNDHDDADECCCGVEIIGAKVRYVGPKGGGQSQRAGRGRKGARGGGRGGRGNKGRAGGKVNNQLQQKHDQKPIEPPSLNQLDLTTNSDINNNHDDGIPLPSKMVDVVVTNPPFGTKNNEGIDVQFLKTAIRLARRAVYSFHKTSTRAYLLKLVQSWGLNVEVVAEMKFDIQNMYRFHREKVRDVDVDLIRVFWEEESDEDKGCGLDMNNESEVCMDGYDIR